MAQWQLSFPSVRRPGFKHPMLNVNTSSWGASPKQILPCALAVGEASEKIMFLAEQQILRYKTHDKYLIQQFWR